MAWLHSVELDGLTSEPLIIYACCSRGEAAESAESCATAVDDGSIKPMTATTTDSGHRLQPRARDLYATASNPDLLSASLVSSHFDDNPPSTPRHLLHTRFRPFPSSISRNNKSSSRLIKKSRK
uniref:Uncharacterized protein n=1 Tax=Plectus sambesii TaxID=2011161 RepID=A0A914W0S9_9BILA